MDYCIVYFSFAVKPFSEEDISAILEHSRRTNAKNDITGMLLYMDGSIIQILEGEQEAVEKLLIRIEQDTRHRNVVSVFRRPIRKRLFDAWSMGYETITSQQLENIKDIVNLYTDEQVKIEAEENIIIKMIKLFYQSNRRRQPLSQN